jgi:3-phenylpropionate/cinnamic acid dioxygenase small subunit
LGPDDEVERLTIAGGIEGIGMTDDRSGPVDDTSYIAIERFLHREAALLDRRAFREWLGLMAADIVYRVTAQIARDAAAGRLDYAIVDEDAVGLKSRVDQISDPRLTRAENPPSFTRRFLSNLQARHGTAPNEFVVETNLLVYRGRPNIPEGGFYVGERRDILRKTAGGMLIARREIRLDQAILYGGSVSTLF